MDPHNDAPRPEFDSDAPEPNAMKPVRISPTGRGSLVCPNCGKDSFTWGVVRGHYDMKFIDDNAGFWSKITVFGGQPVGARKCNYCRNIQLFTGR